MRPLRVFLCHASQDKPTVWKLHRYLKQHGVQPWLDREDLLPGEDWEVEIPKALFASDVILVCLSKNSVNKEGFVQKEITFALDKAMEKPEGTIFIIPVKLEDCEIPRRLTRYQWVDLSRADGHRRLLMGLNKRVTELGSDVSPVILDDARRTTAPKTLKPDLKKPEELIVSVPVKEEIKEEPKKEIPAQVSTPPVKEERPEVKFTQKKPFTKLLDPSSLFPKRILQPQRHTSTGEVVPKQKPTRWLGIGGIVLLVLLFGGFGLNYLVNNLPISTVAVPSPTATTIDTAMPESPTLTSIPFTPILEPTETPTPIPTPTLGIGSTMIGEKGETLVYVPAGEFTMGSDTGNQSDVKPAHTVYLDAFWIDQTEVTNKQYKVCVDGGTCEPPSSTSSYTHPSYYGNADFDNYPVIYVNWDKANRYCEVWAGGHLPTEAQWEKGARGTDSRTYPWGNDAPSKDLLNYHQNVGDTTKVGSYETGKSIFGAYDMAGNVWEWVKDWYGESYYQSPASTNNPLGPESGQYRVLRGGSWSIFDNFARSASRYMNVPASAGNDIGFRCARSP